MPAERGCCRVRTRRWHLGGGGDDELSDPPPAGNDAWGLGKCSGVVGEVVGGG